jgi:hypothetical protein
MHAHSILIPEFPKGRTVVANQKNVFANEENSLCCSTLAFCKVIEYKPGLCMMVIGETSKTKRQPKQTKTNKIDEMTTRANKNRQNRISYQTEIRQCFFVLSNL